MSERTIEDLLSGDMTIWGFAINELREVIAFAEMHGYRMHPDDWSSMNAGPEPAVAEGERPVVLEHGYITWTMPEVYGAPGADQGDDTEGMFPVVLDQCWRCLDPIPKDDELGLCTGCIQALREL